jgi:hypothetical protein
MNRISKLAAIAAIAATGLTSSAIAGPAWEFTTPGNSFTNGQWDFVTAFTANQSVVVTGLGYYADPATGNADGNAVAFYQCDDAACSTTGTLLASTNVTNIYPLTGHFRYVTITPITLVAGTSYEVAGVSNVDNYTWADPGFALDPAISLISDGGSPANTTRWLLTGTPDFLNFIQTDLPGQDGYWGPNVFFGTPTFVPEPASMAVLGIGLAGLGVIRRRRR